MAANICQIHCQTQSYLPPVSKRSRGNFPSCFPAVKDGSSWRLKHARCHVLLPSTAHGPGQASTTTAEVGQAEQLTLNGLSGTALLLRDGILQHMVQQRMLPCSGPKYLC